MSQTEKSARVKKTPMSRDELALARAKDIIKVRVMAAKVLHGKIAPSMVFAIYDSAQLDADGRVDLAATESDLLKAASLAGQAFATPESTLPETTVGMYERLFDDDDEG